MQLDKYTAGRDRHLEESRTVCSNASIKGVTAGVVTRVDSPMLPGPLTAAYCFYVPFVVMMHAEVRTAFMHHEDCLA